MPNLSRELIILIVGGIIIVILGWLVLTKKPSVETNKRKIVTDNLPQNISTGSSIPKVFSSPLSKAAERVTKKTFGLYVTPKTSPIQPERFQGYHSGVDFEVFPEELNTVVTVKAICTGKLRLKEYASGYGGVAAEECSLEGSPVTVVYGHLQLTSIILKPEEPINIGNSIGNLGANHSSETDGERKHLHLGIHKGGEIDIHGYVSSKSDLNNWIDPCQYICHD